MVGASVTAAIAGCSSGTEEAPADADTNGTPTDANTNETPTNPNSEEPNSSLSEVLNFSAPNTFETSPIANSGIVYAPNSDRNIYAIDIGNNEEKWSYETTEAITYPLAYGDNSIYTNKEIDNDVYALDASSGEVNWSLNPEDVVTFSEPVYSDGMVFLERVDIRAYDSATGEFIWESDFDGNGTYSMEVSETRVIGTSDVGVYAVNKESGTVEWSYEGSGDSTELTTTSDQVIYGDDSGTIYILNASDGTEQQQISASPGSEIYQITVSDNTIYYDGDEGITAYDIDSQEEIWVSNVLQSSFADNILDGYLFYTEYDGLKAVDISTGELAIETPIDGGITMPPTVSDNYVVVPNDDNLMLGYEVVIE